VNSNENTAPAASTRLRDFTMLAISLGIIAVLFYCLSGESARGMKPGMKYGLRIGIIVFSLVGWFRSQSLIASRAMDSEKISDRLHDVTASLNTYLHNNPQTADRLLVASSFFIDLFGIFLIFSAVFGQTMRPFVGLLMVFLMRQACQAVCALPTPPKMIWRYPGFPSLLVTYGVANDYFFSGHTAIAVLGAIEIFRICPLWVGLIAVGVAIFEAVTVIVLRAHYTMDIFAAAVAALVAAGLAACLCG